MYELRQFQKDADAALTAAYAAGHKVVMMVLPTGAGKCLGRGTPVLMFDGTIKNVEDVVTGDLLMGPDSKFRRVLSTCKGREQLYRVNPVKGDPYVVNESHILSLKQTGLKSSPKYPCQKGKGKVVNLPVTEYLASSNNFKHTHKGWRAPVSWGESMLPDALPPYLLGVWLGDGSSNGPSVTTADPEIVGCLQAHAKKYGIEFRKQDQPNNASSVYHLTTGWVRGGPSLRSALKSFDLIQNKHIPHIYKTGSDAQRLELLAGMLDSDGHLDHGGYDVVFKVEELATGIAFVARSLGFAAYVTPVRKTCTNTGVTGDYFRISISGDTSRIPTKLKRHQPEPRKQKKSVLVTGVSLEPIGDGEYFGFEIDGDRLFMLGDFTVTHNTVVFTHRIDTFPGISLVMAHRAELVTQASLTLARSGIMHRIIGPTALTKRCAKLHMVTLGAQFISSNARVICASVQTLDGKDFALRYPVFANILPQVGQWVCDEGHHLLAGNMWGRVVAKMPNAIGLVPTATPERADGKGLGRHADGLVDEMVVGPTQRELIDWGFLTNYQIFSPPSSFDMCEVSVSTATGDFNATQLRAAAHKQKKKIVGDLVDHYFRWAPNKLTLCFVTDLDTADGVCAGFNQRGVKAAVISSKTDDLMRAQIMKQFAEGLYRVLVNVDILGEGVDVPAVEAVILGRPTESFSLFNQQCGRPLRLADNKEVAIIIDAVGNVQRHARVVEYPDGRTLIDLSRGSWSLDRRESRGSSKSPDPDEIKMSRCSHCTKPYSGLLYVCPHCGHDNSPKPGERTLQNVDGDLTLLTAEDLAAMQGKRDQHVAKYAAAASKLSAAHMAGAAMKQHKNAQLVVEAGGRLDNAIRFFGGYYESMGQTRSSTYRRFTYRYGMDVMTAQGLPAKESDELTARICQDIANKQLTLW